MTAGNGGHRRNAGLDARSPSGWRRPLLLGIVGLGFLLVYLAQSSRPGPGPRPDAPGDVVSRRATEVSRLPDDLRGTRSRQRAVSKPAMRERTPDVRGASAQPEPTRGAVSAARRPPASTEEAYESRHVSHELVADLLRVSQSDGGLTPEEAQAINEILRELAEQGTAAVPAIRDVLRQMEDVNFDELSGGDLVDHGSLRLALFDILSQIGGREAIAVSLEQLRETRDPVEIAMLARNLEAQAPGTYREEMLRAAHDALLRAGQSPREERADVSPLFELFQAYGGVDVVTDLERDIAADWWEYSLMALAGLPEGQGIPSLVAQAVDPRVKAEFPLRMLAQASAQYPQAGEALVDLARSGKVPDGAWAAIGDALEGRHLQFPLQLFDGTPHEENGAEVPPADGTDVSNVGDVETPQLREYYIEYMNMRYEQRLVSTNWSDDQIGQQLALIDALLNATSNPAAARALREARASLQGSG